MPAGRRFRPGRWAFHINVFVVLRGIGGSCLIDQTTFSFASEVGALQYSYRNDSRERGWACGEEDCGDGRPEVVGSPAALIADNLKT
jgi:hypothetical protein